MSIIVAAVMLTIGLIVVSEMKDVSKEMDTTSTINETVTLSGDIGSVAQRDLFIVATACRNASAADGEELPLKLGTWCNVTGGDVKVAALNDSTGVRIDYSYYKPTTAYNASGAMVTNLSKFPTWIGIILIVALAMIVLSYFYGRRE